MRRARVLAVRGETTAALALLSGLPATGLATFIVLVGGACVVEQLGVRVRPILLSPEAAPFFRVLWGAALYLYLALAFVALTLRLREAWLRNRGDHDGPELWALPLGSRLVLRCGRLIRGLGCLGLSGVAMGLVAYCFSGLDAFRAPCRLLMLLGWCAAAAIGFLTPAWVALRRAETDRDIVTLATEKTWRDPVGADAGAFYPGV